MRIQVSCIEIMGYSSLPGYVSPGVFVEEVLSAETREPTPEQIIKINDAQRKH